MNRTCCRKAAAFFFILSLFSMFPLAAEEPDAAPCLVETSVWMLANLMPDPPDFYQLSLGYRLDEKNIIFLNGLTWTYGAPLGIPFGPDFESTDEEYPGYVRAFGIGVGYQRFIWKGIFTTLTQRPSAELLRGRRSSFKIGIPAVPSDASWVSARFPQRPAVSETRALLQLLAGEHEFARFIPREGKGLAQLFHVRAPSEHRLQVLAGPDRVLSERCRR
jgi:hypothetical protein